MTILGVELNDAAIAAVDDASVLYSEPGYAVAADAPVQFGWKAWQLARRYPRRAQRRYWRELSEQSLLHPLGRYRSAADLVHAQLEEIWHQCEAGVDGVILAVPAYWSADTLALLLGIAQEIGLPVQGLVDAAVAATRREYRGGDLFHIDASLHDLVVTRIAQQDGRAAVAERRVIDAVGVEGLERACIDFIARRFVETSRFDPLHDGKSEEFLYEQLYPWLSKLSRQKELLVSASYRNNEFDARLELAALQDHLSRVCEPLIQQVRGALKPGVPVAIQVHSRLTDFPGVIEALGKLPQATVFALEPAAAARGAQRRAGQFAAGAAGFRLVTSLPWDQPAAVLDVVAPSGSDAPQASARPTHVLFAGCAYRLGDTPFQIGAEVSESDFGVRLDDRMNGVSRRHCSIEFRDAQVVVSDHSRFGTLLNGHAIDGAAILQAGDVLSLGNPPREFQLISEVTPDGA